MNHLFFYFLFFFVAHLYGYIVILKWLFSFIFSLTQITIAIQENKKNGKKIHCHIHWIYSTTKKMAATTLYIVPLVNLWFSGFEKNFCCCCYTSIFIPSIFIGFFYYYHHFQFFFTHIYRPLLLLLL